MAEKSGRKKIIGSAEIEEKRLTTPIEQAEDQNEKLSLRPQRLDQFIGQERVRGNLRISIQAAANRNEPMDHILFYGPPGLGKTTLAHIIAHEMEANLHRTSGPSLERPGDLMSLLTNLEYGNILFIDEIHRMPRIVEEFMYPAMEDFEIDFVIDKGPHARSIKFSLKRFTLIGATTRAGLLSAPLRDRFGIFHHLDFYTDAELTEIIRQAAKVLSVDVTDDGATEIAGRSRGTPRIANRLLARVRDFSEVNCGGAIDKETADKALKLLGIDQMGLDTLDRKYLTAILDQYNGGPVGVNAIAATLQEETDTLVDVVEPFLLKIGFISRTSRGRRATNKASAHLGFKEQPGTGSLDPFFA